VITVNKRSTDVIFLQSANLLVRFLLELSALAALGYWGYNSASTVFGKLALGLGAPLLAAIVWGVFVSPKAAIPLSTPLWLLVQLGVFGAAIVALVVSGHPSLGWTLGLTVVLNGALMYWWRQ
jgi:hypothetical protein